jgi:hypothetical protein
MTNKEVIQSWPEHYEQELQVERIVYRIWLGHNSGIQPFHAKSCLRNG